MDPSADRAARLAATRAELLNWYRPLFAPDHVFELRALRVRRGPHGGSFTESGYFDAGHLKRAVAAVEGLYDGAGGIYFTLNPLKPELLARRAHRTDRAGRDDCAKDGDVLSRRWMLVDVDPVRASGIGATDAEKASARVVTDAVREFLRREGAPDPILADSGNGYHLLYRVDLPADDGGRVERLLKSLAKNFDAPGAKVDCAVHNPSRICKLPGTVARKGDATADRPHRRSALLDLPGTLGVFPPGIFDLLAPAPTKPEPPIRSAKSYSGARLGDSRLDVPKWLGDRGVAYRVKDGTDALGRTIYVLAACPFDPSHADPDACVMQDGGGALSAKCFHDSCADKGWREFKAALGAPEPRHYNRPPASPRRKVHTIARRPRLRPEPPPAAATRRGGGRS